MSNISLEVTRQQLYEQVWNEPAYKVAMRYGVSEMTISKVCDQNKIPKPSNSYRHRIAKGEQAWKADLPHRTDEQVIKITRRCEQIGKEDPDLLDKVCEIFAFEKNLENKIIVADELKNPHPITEELQEASKTAFVSNGGYYYIDAPLKVIVTKQQLPRALRIIDTLCKAFEQRGYDLSNLSIFESDMTIELQEHYEAKLKSGVMEAIAASPDRYGYRYDDHERTPSGRLILSLEMWRTGEGLKRNWKDGKTQKLEDLLNDFICGATRQAAVSREWSLERERWHREREEEKQRRKEEAERLAKEQARREKLHSDAQQWENAELLRRYIDAVTRKGKQADTDLSLKNWVEWATTEAQRIDPLIQGNIH